MENPPVYYPVFLDLRDRSCLVIGEGELADEKARGLEQAGARVLRNPAFDPDRSHVFLIVAVTGDPALGRRIKEFADRRGILVNVVDQTPNCGFIAPAIARRGDLVLAISTSGKSPALARKIRQQLEAQFGPEYGDLVRALGEIRPLVKERLNTFRERSEYYNRMVRDPELLETARCHGAAAVRSRLEEGLQ
jgi:siroheme synthase-like protein